MLSGEATLPYYNFCFLSLLHEGQLLKQEFAPLGSKFLPLRVDSIFEGISCPGKQTGNHNHKIISFSRNGRKAPKYTIHCYMILSAMDRFLS